MENKFSIDLEGAKRPSIKGVAISNLCIEKDGESIILNEDEYKELFFSLQEKVMPELSTALFNAYEFIDCDKKHSHPEIRTYANRVCDELDILIKKLHGGK